jgi:hypothetical protein
VSVRVKEERKEKRRVGRVCIEQKRKTKKD